MELAHTVLTRPWPRMVVTLLGAVLVAVGVAAANSDARPAVSALAGCRLSRFAVSLGPLVSEATGQHTLALRLLNHGPTSCVLDGYPEVTLSDAAGVIPFVIRRGGDQMISSRPPQPVLVRPSQTAFVVLNKYRCDQGATRSTRTIKIGMRGTRGSGTASISFGKPSKVPFPYRIPDYCGAGDPGSILTVSPFVATVDAALGG